MERTHSGSREEEVTAGNDCGEVEGEEKVAAAVEKTTQWRGEEDTGRGEVEAAIVGRGEVEAAVSLGFDL